MARSIDCAIEINLPVYDKLPEGYVLLNFCFQDDSIGD